MGKSPKKPITKRKWFWPVVGVFAVGAIAGGGGDKEEQKQPPVEPDTSVVQVDTSDRSTIPDMFNPVENISSQTTAPEPDISTSPDESEPKEQNQKPETPENPEQTSDIHPEKEPEPVTEPEPIVDPKQEPDPVVEPDNPKNTNSAGKERRSNWSSGAYLGSTESDKYHDYECRAAKKILPENEVWFSSEADAQAAGYSRCGICW